MTLLFLLTAFQAANVPALPPAEAWPSLLFIPVNAVTIDDSATIMRLAVRRPECRTGVRPSPNHMERLDIDLALLIAPDGLLLQTVAAPGPCDAIRNQARAIINARYVSGGHRPEGPAPAWYRTGLGISWSL